MVWAIVRDVYQLAKVAGVAARVARREHKQRTRDTAEGEL